MTTKADYAAEEWELIMKAPIMAAIAVAASSPSGPIGLVKEMFAVGGSLQNVGQEDSPNPLVNALVTDLKAGSRPSAPVEPSQGLEGAKAQALQTLREVAELLARKAPASEADGFKQWLLTTARRVSEAAKEGGFLGIGGVRVSDAEKAALTEIGRALAVGPGDTPHTAPP